ncbi:MAG: hypothetical protein LBP85_04355 [Prevotellaceae bacterium]|jgi:hypothetical protein|nr:hypothetical protein [Prevotellaceae bacterium]
MTRKKGTQKTGGRAKGTPNKITIDLRTWIAALIDNNRQQLEKDLLWIEPKERWQVVEKLMQYTLPKMQSVETAVNMDNLTDEQINLIISEITKDLSDE